MSFTSLADILLSPPLTLVANHANSAPLQIRYMPSLSSGYYEVPLYEIPLTIAEVGDAIGKSGSTSAVGITDPGLCDALVKLI